MDCILDGLTKNLNYHMPANLYLEIEAMAKAKKIPVTKMITELLCSCTMPFDCGKYICKREHNDFIRVTIIERDGHENHRLI